MMHDEHHKSKSFARDTFSRFAKKHGIAARMEPIDRYGLMPPSKLKEARHFNVFLDMGEKSMSFTVSFPDYRRVHLPPIEDVLEHLANEVAAYESFGDDPQAFAAFSGASLEAAARYMEDAGAAAGSARAFFGPALYKELASITEQRGPS